MSDQIPLDVRFIREEILKGFSCGKQDRHWKALGFFSQAKMLKPELTKRGLYKILKDQAVYSSLSPLNANNVAVPVVPIPYLGLMPHSTAHFNQV